MHLAFRFGSEFAILFCFYSLQLNVSDLVSMEINEIPVYFDMRFDY